MLSCYSCVNSSCLGIYKLTEKTMIFKNYTMNILYSYSKLNLSCMEISKYLSVFNYSMLAHTQGFSYLSISGSKDYLIGKNNLLIFKIGKTRLQKPSSITLH